jgi:DNA-binding GntR family transcriptional regulator
MTQVKSTNKDAYTLILEAIDTGVYRPGDRLVKHNRFWRAMGVA